MKFIDNANSSTAHGTYLILRDENMKIICRIQQRMQHLNPFDSSYTFTVANSTTLLTNQGDVNNAIRNMELYEENLWSINVSGSSVSVSLRGAAPVSVGLFDGTANTSKPKYLEIWGNGPLTGAGEADGTRGMNLRGWKMYLNPVNP